MPAYESFALGGPLRLSAYRINEFSGRKYWLGRLMYYNRTLPLPELLGSGIYVGGSAELGRIVERVDGLPSTGTLWSARRSSVPTPSSARSTWAWVSARAAIGACTCSSARLTARRRATRV